MANKSPRSRRTANVDVPQSVELSFQHLFEGVGGRFAEDIRERCKSGLVPVEYEVDPGTYTCADTFRRDYLLAVMLSKFDDGKSSEKKVSAAMEKFHLAEERCRETNERLSRSATGKSLINGLPVSSCLFTAARKISRLLGDLDLNEAALGFGFGPGASTRLSRRQSDTWYKFSGKPEVTYNCTIFADAVFQHSPLWKRGVLSEGGEAQQPFEVVRANRVVTVPKNAKTDRVIAIEPDLNLFVQKGFGAIFRRRLQKVGVDLNDQTVNQRLAREGSIDGSLATIDLSMASDTVSRGIVEQLLPPDWLLALEQCRSPEGVLPSGDLIRYQKFSSMGNGFTFELESLIFWALVSSVAELTGEKDRRISVYGDDIICPVGIVEPVMGLLEYCGFSINRGKSFWAGPFRESCGKHYFSGTDVSPFFVRSHIRRLSDVFLTHNNVVRWSIRGASSYRDEGHNQGTRRFLACLRESVPSSWRKPRIPDGVGDGAFIGSFDEVCPKRAPKGYEGWRAEVLSEPRLSSDRGGEPRLLKSLYGLERRAPSITRGETGELPLRHIEASNGLRYGLYALPADFAGRVDGFLFATDPGGAFVRRIQVVTGSYGVPLSKRAKIVKIFVRQWAELGPWF
jgi:hypothetical protein